jgi:hypothetical protein
MPAEAGIHSFVDIKNIKNLDSRFRGHDDIFPMTAQSLQEGRARKKG